MTTHIEFQFLSEFGAGRGDDDSRLVYADWLEERDELRAEFVRLEMEICETHYRTSVTHLLNRLVALSKLIDDRDWEKDVLFNRVTEIMLPLARNSMQSVRKKKYRRRQNRRR